MNASSIIARNKDNLKLVLDFLPNYTEEELIKKLKEISNFNSKLSLKDLTHGILPKMLANKMCEMLKNNLNIESFVKLAKNYIVSINGTYGFDNAQICVGGINLNEINENLELKKHPNIYTTGEVIDIDGLCGGYNLQFAFASAYVATLDIYNKEGK